MHLIINSGKPPMEHELWDLEIWSMQNTQTKIIITLLVATVKNQDDKGTLASLYHTLHGNFPSFSTHHWMRINLGNPRVYVTILC